jgi:hypothetical protein
MSIRFGRAAQATGHGTQVTDFPADYAASSEGDLTEAIREERRLELAFEYTSDGTTSSAGELVMRCSRAQVHWNRMMNFDALTGIITFPLPQDELDRNENLKPQNSGY